MQQVTNVVYEGMTALKMAQIYDSSYTGRYHSEVVKNDVYKLGDTGFYGFAFRLQEDWQFFHNRERRTVSPRTEAKQPNDFSIESGVAYPSQPSTFSRLMKSAEGISKAFQGLCRAKAPSPPVASPHLKPRKNCALRTSGISLTSLLTVNFLSLNIRGLCGIFSLLIQSNPYSVSFVFSILITPVGLRTNHGPDHSVNCTAPNYRST